jgi:type VI secretion system protein ImpA
MPDLDIDALQSPLPGDDPCGPNLEYDPAFQALQEAAAGKPERQYGATIIPAEPPDWPAVHQQALALAMRTRDLRVAAWLTRSAARVEGFSAAVRGLQLTHALLDRYWAQLHPVLDASDGNDPTARLNALWPLHQDAGLADLRSAPLTSARGSITVRDLELAFGRADALPGEPVPTEEGATPAIAAAQAQVPGLALAMAAGLQAAQGIAKVLDDRLGVDQSPDLSRLSALMQSIAQAGSRAQGGSAVALAAAEGVAAPTSPPMAAVALGSIQSREDAIRTLERVSEWIERNEPTNPAPLFIQRAQRLMKKNFMEIIRDLVPEGLGQIEKLAGSSQE